jgi:hypothetical protein
MRSVACGATRLYPAQLIARSASWLSLSRGDRDRFTGFAGQKADGLRQAVAVTVAIQSLRSVDTGYDIAASTWKK